MHFSGSLTDVDLSHYKLLILDSVNDAGLTLENYKELRHQYPDLAIILILQKNKKGEFKGGKDWEHEVEIFGNLYKNEEGKRLINITKNRYGVLGEKAI